MDNIISMKDNLENQIKEAKYLLNIHKLELDRSTESFAKQITYYSFVKHIEDLEKYLSYLTGKGYI